MQNLFVVLLVLGAVNRMTRLFTADSMPFLEKTRRYIYEEVPFFRGMLHEAVDKNGDPTGKIFGCDWCASMWFAAPIVVTATVLFYDGSHGWFVAIAGTLAASYVTGISAALESGD